MNFLWDVLSVKAPYTSPADLIVFFLCAIRDKDDQVLKSRSFK